jgi:diguanylate cyclase (GGDEF)-like protein
MGDSATQSSGSARLERASVFGGPEKRPRILLADADESLRSAGRDVLQAEGFSVVEAIDGLEAAHQLDVGGLHLVLLDARIGDHDGYDVCAAIRASHTHLPIILTTADDDPESIGLAYRAGATDLVIKPLNWTLMRHRVRAMLRAAEDLRALDESQHQLATAQLIAKIGSYEISLPTGAVRASDELRRIYQVRDDEVLAATLLSRIHPDDRADLAVRVRKAIDRRGSYAMDHRLLFDDQRVLRVHSEGRAVCDSSGSSIAIAGTCQDVTQRWIAEEKIRNLAYNDRLTGLANRQLFRELLDRSLRRAKSQRTLLALLYVDLDDFKLVNDTFGRAAGDRFLLEVASRLSESTRSSDTLSRQNPDGGRVSRLGGDEFALFLEGLRRPEDAMGVARRLLDALSIPIDVSDEVGPCIYPRASIGIALFPDHGGDADTLLRNADTAMYSAKGQGKSRFAFYEDALNERSRTRLDLENALRGACDAGEFSLQYQPRFALGDGRLTGAEALIRWKRGGIEPVAPDVFIPIAEETGEIDRIGSWVLETVCAQIRSWQDAGHRVGRIGVNVSGRQFTNPGFAAGVREIVSNAGVSPTAIELEVTESILMKSEDSAVAILRALRDDGFTVAVDDFGTGYSSLARIQELPVQSLKIDRMFVSRLGEDEKADAIVSAIVALAEGLSLCSIAEGVETQEQAERLRQLGCDEVQGYLFGRPAPAEQLEESMRS